MQPKSTCLPPASQISVTIVETTTSTYTPSSPLPTYSPRACLTPHGSPPPYPNAQLSPLSPLSFFPSTTRDPNNILPSYRSVPRTHAEKCFWIGIFFPFFWIVGLMRIWRPEPCVGAGKHAGDDLELGVPSWYTSSNPVESIALWREEERLWACRCAWCFGGFTVVAALFCVVFVSMAAH